MRALPALAATVCSAVAGVITTSSLALPVQAAVTTTTVRNEAVAACEQSARRTLTTTRAAKTAEVTFNAQPTEQPGLSTENQLVLTGEGRWMSDGGMRRVGFICNVDRHTLEATGMVIRDITPAAARPTPTRAPTEPDLSRLSMASCESSAVQALQRRWPAVSQISFDGDTRSYRQESADRAVLRGRGRAQPSREAPSTYFGFTCEVDPKDGWVLRTRLTE